jgi:cytochrome c oxidase assembly protein subunit 11
MTVRLGETHLAFYRATNTSDRTVKGSAVFNVLPEATGIHFNKIECFCFKEQTLAPGETIDMPVSFFIDAAMARDADLKGVDTVTLSYTFYRLDEPKPASAAETTKDLRRGT